MPKNWQKEAQYVAGSPTPPTARQPFWGHLNFTAEKFPNAITAKPFHQIG